jgi:subtilisin-like proprotein convertase family protein
MDAIVIAASQAALPPDPGLGGQWHLRNPGGVDADVTRVWADYTGRGIRVGIVDDGFDLGHPDLAAVFGSGGWDARGNDAIPLAEGDDRHGTAVAGVIGADANGSGLVGVAHDATLIGFRMGFGNNGTQAQVVTQLRNQAGVDVSNNSWGYLNPFADDFANAAYVPIRDALVDATASGRGGLGTAIVFAAGNGRKAGDSVNHHGLQSAPQVIAVAAVDQVGKVAPFSTPGAALLLSAPGVDILTTDRRGAEGYVAGDAVIIDGTSFAAPVVSGIVALMLEANPGLGWRDVHEILALSARLTDFTSPSWTLNAAGTWNGSGMRFSNDYGFGLADAHAAVRLAESWEKVSTSANLQTVSATTTSNLAIPDASPTGITSTAALVGGVLIDRVQVTLDIRHSWIGDLVVSLVSPKGTESVLLDRPGTPALNVGGLDMNDLRFTVSSNAFWGENSGGVWRLKVSDRAGSDTGSLASWSISARGDTATDDTVWVFTDSFAQLVAANPLRGTITDAIGNDTINAAAVSGSVVLDLAKGAGTIGGAALKLGAGTRIETVFSGDGADTLAGDGFANRFSGGRGDDTIDGGGGLDTASFAVVAEEATIGWVGNTLVLSHGMLGADRMRNIEILDFADRDIAVAALLPDAALLPTLLLSAAGAVGSGDAVAKGIDGMVAAGTGAVLVDWGPGDSVSATVTTAWTTVRTATVRETGGADVTLANFVEVLVALGGATASNVAIAGTKRGAVSTGTGDDVITVTAFSNGADAGGFGNGFTISAGGGNDVIAVTGWSVWTYASIDAGVGDDSVRGSSGADTIRGGAGRDMLWGGAGRDIFAFRAGDGADVIADFNAAAVDRVRIEGVARENVTWSAAEGGTLLRYGTADTVFLAGLVTGFDASDLLFA